MFVKGKKVGVLWDRFSGTMKTRKGAFHTKIKNEVLLKWTSLKEWQ